MTAPQQAVATQDYVAYGLRIRSTLPLPFPPWAGPADGEVAVEVDVGATPADLPAGAEKRPAWQGMPGRFLSNRAGIARYFVADGRRIVVEPQGGNAAEIGALLIGPMLGALLQQRGIVTLHASSVATPAGAVLFLGRSGAGKSSILAALVKSGYAMMADDVTGVVVEDGRLLAIPGFPRMRLLADSLANLGWRTSATKTSDGKRPFVAESFHPTPLPLRACYVLALSDDVDHTAIAPLGARPALWWLSRHTYRRGRLRALGQQAGHFRAVCEVAARIPLFELTRPAQGHLDHAALSAIVSEHLATHVPPRDAPALAGNGSGASAIKPDRVYPVAPTACRVAPRTAARMPSRAKQST